MRLSQLARNLNVGTSTIVDFLEKKGYRVENNPNTKLTDEQVTILTKEFASSAQTKQEAQEIEIKKVKTTLTASADAPSKNDSGDEEVRIKDVRSDNKEDIVSNRNKKLTGPVVLGKVDISKPKPKATEEKPSKKEEEAPQVKKEAEVKADPIIVAEIELIGAKADKLEGVKVLGKIELPKEMPKKKPGDFAKQNAEEKKIRKRKKISVKKIDPREEARKNRKEKERKEKEPVKKEISSKEVQDQLKQTLARIQGSKGSGLNRSKYRKEKRDLIAEETRLQQEQDAKDAKILKITEFISANQLASLMNVSVNEVISTCLSMGMFVSINQRLDAEAITVIADEFGYDVSFVSAEEEAKKEVEIVDNPENLKNRAPIVTIMGHVDHGKTSLLDYIRSANVTASEAGGITQHIGAYSVMTEQGKRISFLDTPGHEAFTAMRARGAQLTDIVIIVVAADDAVMPQTKEAINHAKAAGVPIIIAINKVDKENANPDKIREQLANENILVEEWGGKYQCQEISAKKGLGINELLDKVLLEAEILDLKANPNAPASGTVVEAALDKGKGYVATVLVQRGTLKIGDVVLAGSHFGKIKAMSDHIGNKLKEAGPSVPVQILGLDGAPQAGDKFAVKENEREAREIATSRSQIMREQTFRTKKHITLDEIGRRLAVGNFKELNIIVKGDFDGSVEALTDSLLKLSTNEVAVNIISKGVGQITESDVLLASASDAIIVGFQVRASLSAKKLAENEEIQIKYYSVIYAAIEEIKVAMEGLLAPTEEEVIVGNAEVRDTFKITKVGTIAGCMVTDGLIKRNNKCRLIREGVVLYEGEISTLKRFKDDASEVKSGYECGIGIKNFNDINVGDVIESFEIKEVKRKL